MGDGREKPSSVIKVAYLPVSLTKLRQTSVFITFYSPQRAPITHIQTIPRVLDYWNTPRMYWKAR